MDKNMKKILSNIDVTDTLLDEKQKIMNELLRQHELWLKMEGGERLDLSGIYPRVYLKKVCLDGADLEYANLSHVNLSGARIRKADFTGADLSGANLTNADLPGSKFDETNVNNAILDGALLSGATFNEIRFYNVSMQEANLKDAYFADCFFEKVNLVDADLHNTVMRSVDTGNANMMGVKGLISSSDFMAKNFEHSTEGYFAYLAFDSSTENLQKDWEIKPGSVIEAYVNHERGRIHGNGIRVSSTEELARKYASHPCPIWKVLVRYEWLADVCVPFSTFDNIRCGRVQLIKQMN